MSKARVTIRVGVCLAAAALVFAYTAYANLARAVSPSQQSFYCGFTQLGRQGCYGFLSNQDFFDSNPSDYAADDYVMLGNTSNPTLDSIPDTINSAAALESLYENYLARGSTTRYDYDSFGAAATIDIMIGATGPDVCLWYTSGASSTCTWQAAVAYAQNAAHLADWESRVNYYASNNWIRWLVNFTIPLGTPDMGHECSNDAGCGNGTYPPTPLSADAQDVVMTGDAGETTNVQLVEFDDPVDGTQFSLDHYCGNIVGYTTGLQAPGFNVNPSLNSSTTTVQPGQTYQLTVGAFNTGPNSSLPGSLQIPLPTDVASPCAATCTGAATNMSDLSPPGTTTRYLFNHCGCTAIQGVSPPYWEWDTNPLTRGQPYQATLTFTVAANAQPNDTITFTAYFYPADAADDISQTTLQFTVGTVRTPTVVGENADIHAGGGVCSQSQNSSAFITTSPGSYGSYAVSAPGMISGMGSNGSPTDSSLQLGQGGGYATVCRPDLYQSAIDNPPTGAGTLTGGTFDVGTDFNSGPNITIENGKAVAYVSGNVDLSGTYHGSRPLTLVVTGDVTISGDISVSGGSGRSDMPSIGIITNGTINIAPAATTVDAMLFSDNAINTCYTAAAPVPPQCDDVLTVTGFLMAPNIQLLRLGS